MNRRGYFFVIDAVIASIILFVGLFVLFSGSVATEDTVQPLAVMEDFLATVGTQPLTATLDPYYTGTLLPANLTPYPDATPLEQIIYLNYTNCALCDEHATNYTLSLLAGALGDQYGAAIYVNGTVIAERPHPQRYQLVRTFLVYARLNDTHYVGPLTAEIRLWG